MVTSISFRECHATTVLVRILIYLTRHISDQSIPSKLAYEPITKRQNQIYITHDLGMGHWLGSDRGTRGTCIAGSGGSFQGWFFSVRRWCNDAFVLRIAGILKYSSIVNFPGSRLVFHL